MCQCLGKVQHALATMWLCSYAHNYSVNNNNNMY